MMYWIFIILFLILVFLYPNETYEHYTNSQIDNKIKTLEEQIQSVQNATCPGPIKVPCQVGPQGPPGPPGGTFSNMGPLRNLGDTSQFMDRLFGMGTDAVPFLATQNYRPQQTWTLESNKKLSNQYGGCLYGDANTNLVYMASCNSSPQGLQWLYDKNGRLRLNADQEKCLTPIYEGIVKNSDKKEGLEKKGLDKYSRLMQVKLAKCENINSAKSNDQQWTFY